MENLYVISLKTLKAINKDSIAKKYNRTIEWGEFQSALMRAMNASEDLVWAGLKTKVILSPLMVHELKDTKDSEPHVRCHVFENGLVNPFLLLDVSMDWFETLEVYVGDHKEKLAA